MTAERTEWLAQEGYTVLRVTNEQVREDVMAVVEWVMVECERLKKARTEGSERPPSP